MSLPLRPLVSLGLSMSLQAALPPLIDRNAFFGEVQIAAAQISPDGRYISFLKPYKGTRNIWVKKADEPFSAAKPISADSKRPIPAYFWSRDSRFILYVQDQAGDENYNVYAVDPTGTPEGATGVPASRNITEAKGARAEIFDLPRKDPDILYVGLNDRDKAWHDLYRLRISTGERTLIRKNTDRVSEWMFDNSANLRLALRTDDNGNTEVLRVDADKLAPVYSCDVFESCAPIKFDHANRQVYLITNKGPGTDLVELSMLDPASGHVTPVEQDPAKRVDFGNAMFSEVDDRLIATVYEDDRPRTYFKDPAFEADYKWLQSKAPGKEFRFESHTADENTWIVSAFSDTEPGETYLLDRKNKSLQLQYRIREELPRDSLAARQSIHYKSSDGLEIPAYLTVPKGVEQKNLPLIVFPHGGPWARDEWRFDAFAQYLANRGYAVLQPNFRGSTGYGKKFLNAGNGEWGRKMQDDLTWGVKYLVAQGTVNPKRVGISGGSYGGYATLAGVAYTPDLYSAAVAIVAPSDLVFLLHSIPPYWEAMRKIMYTRMANPDSPEGKKILEAESPVKAAGQIRTPLMVVQGANDPRVNKRNSDEIVVALRDRNVPVKYLVAPDEGHGFARPINNLAMVAAMERFFSQHLDGRYQQELPTDVGTRLREITVDPKTVALATEIKPSDVGAPTPAVDLTPSLRKYDARIEAGTHTIRLNIANEIQEHSGKWAVVQTFSTTMGEVTDTVIVEKQTLVVTEQHLNQGPINIDMMFGDGKVSGSMVMNGQTRPINIDAGGPVFAQSAASVASIAMLPLAEGYTAKFRNIDVQKHQPKLLQLAVAAIEQVAVPAGNFNAYRVEVTSADGGNDRLTVWVAKESRQPVKYTLVANEMGGATVTAELLK